MIKRILAGITSLLMTSVLAVEYFADANYGNDDWDGTCATNVVGTLHGPKKTLQEAIELADGVNQTIITALPGVYNRGEFTSGDHHARIGITKKNIRLRSALGKHVTHIVGVKAATETGIGAGALRGIYIGDRVTGYGVSQSTNVVVEGFTIRDCATRASSGATGQGGGVYNPDKGEQYGGAMLIDCVVSNCAAATGGAISRIAAYRTLFIDNYANDGAVANFAQMACCVLYGNRSSTGALRRMYNVFGCSIIANKCQAYTAGYSSNSHIYNSLSIGNAGGNGGKNTESNLRLVNGVAEAPAFFNEVDAKSNTSASRNQYVSSAFGDWRILETSEIAVKVSASSLNNFILPPGYSWADYLGNSIDVKGMMHPGAIQSSIVMPQHGCVEFDSDFDVDGYGVAYAGTSTYSDVWPIIYKMRPIMPNGTACYSVEISDGCNEFQVPQYDGSVRVVPSPTATESFSLTAIAAANILYVDNKNGNDAWDGSSDIHVVDTQIGPKKTLQSAADVANVNKYDYTLVRVAPGVYDEGGIEAMIEGHACSNRLSITRSMGFVAANGVGTAIIKGAPDMSTGSIGPGAMRCCLLAGSKCYLQGFVLTGGYSQDGDKFWMKGAAAYCGSSATASIFDCILSNNTAKVNAATYYGRLVRSRVIDNFSEQGDTLSYTKLYSCIVAGNRFGGDSSYSPVGLGCEPVGCTIDAGEYTAVNKNCYIFGNVIVNSARGYITSVSLGNAIVPQAQFADISNYDYRLGQWSSPIGFMSVDDYAQRNIYSRFTSDVDGNDLIVKEGKLTVGAVHNQPLLPMIAITSNGGNIAVTGMSLGTNVVVRETQLTVEATDSASRPFAGFNINGEIIPATGTSTTFTISPLEPSQEICAIYGTNWYVNAISGDDHMSGGSLSTAKKTIRAAAELAISNDVIHVAAGSYGDKDGTMIHTKRVDEGTAPITISSRVVLKSGVGMVADEGPEETFIVGSAANSSADGLGETAVRCLVLEKNAWAKGFTLTGGHTDAGSTPNDDNDAGAVLGYGSSNTTVSDCIISNNIAARSGAGFKVRFVNCKILNNKSTVRASVGRECAFVQCYIDNNEGPNVTEYHDLIDSCTFGPNNFYPDPEKNYQVVLNAGSTIGAVNTIFAGPKLSRNGSNYMNCLFLEDCGVNVSSTIDCIFTNYTALALDKYGRPIVGRSAAVDRGTSVRTLIADNETDISGFQRIMNGVRDIGAFEADWRPQLGRKIGGKICVLSASQDVVVQNSAVVIPDGSLSFATTAQNDYKLSFAVTGAGLLTITTNNTILGQYQVGEYTLNLSNVHADTCFNMSYAPGVDDSGAAELIGMRREIGSLVIIR